MITAKKYALAVGSIALLNAPAIVSAATVTTETLVTPKDIPNTTKIDFMSFDLNGDTILSMSEVGRNLFKLFDRDGNEVIDNNEYEYRNIMTIIPMQKETFTFVDEDSDGKTDTTSYTYEDFVKYSGLMRFDKNMDGLSPEEFIDKSFNQMDGNNSKVIELSEWETAYTTMVHAKTADPNLYNK
jgi:Ca2+-binding EF-hand superfamily protein